MEIIDKQLDYNPRIIKGDPVATWLNRKKDVALPVIHEKVTIRNGTIEIRNAIMLRSTHRYWLRAVRRYYVDEHHHFKSFNDANRYLIKKLPKDFNEQLLAYTDIFLVNDEDQIHNLLYSILNLHLHE